MPLGRVTVHTAVPISPSKEGEWVEGRRERKDAPGTPFACLLQLPAGGTEENAPRGRRTIKQPQILYENFDATGGELSISPADELAITAPEVTGPDPVRWQVDGAPTPLAKPGFRIGFMARLKRVED